MVKQREKYIKKINKQKQIELLQILEQIFSLNRHKLDIKKIQWQKNIYRCRIWDLRIVFEQINNKITIKNIWTGCRGGFS